MATYSPSNFDGKGGNGVDAVNPVHAARRFWLCPPALGQSQAKPDVGIARREWPSVSSAKTKFRQRVGNLALTSRQLSAFREPVR